MFDGQSCWGASLREINQDGEFRACFQTPRDLGRSPVVQGKHADPCFAKRDGAFQDLNALSSVPARRDRLDRKSRERMVRDEARRQTPIMHAASMSRGDKRRLEISMAFRKIPRLFAGGMNHSGVWRGPINQNTIDLLKQIKDEPHITIAPIIRTTTCMCVFMAENGHRVGFKARRWVRRHTRQHQRPPKVREAYLGRIPRRRPDGRGRSVPAPRDSTSALARIRT